MTIPSDSDWGRCITDFINHIYSKSNSPHSQDHYRAGLEEFFTRVPRKLPHEYSKAEVIAWMVNTTCAAGREGRQASAALQNNRLIILAGLYRYSQSYGIQGDDGHLYPLMRYLPPTAGIHHLKRPDGGNKALSDEELKKFFAAIPRDTPIGKRNYALMSCYFWCARRAQEIITIRWRDLEQTLIVDGQGTRQAWVYRWKGKGHASRDDLAEMPPIAAAAIFDYLEASGRLPTMETDDYLFTALPGYIGRGGYDPKRPLARQSILDLAQKYAEIAGLSDRRMHIHTLRHTSARASYAAGDSIREVQQKLRHKNMATTSIYLETLISVSDPTLDRLNAKFANL